MYNEDNKKRGSLLTKLLLVLLIVIIFIFALAWLFPTKGSLNPLYQDVFRNNINSMKDAAETYFTNERMPQNVGDKVKITLSEMEDKNLLLPFIDRYGKTCDKTKSYVEITKTETEYEMKVNLVCSQEESYIIEHMGCTDKCNNCNKLAIEYQYQKEVQARKISGYTCDKGYTLKGNACYKTTDAIAKKDAEPVYKTNTTTKDSIENEKVTKATYSGWSDWSENKEYDPDNNNITWGEQELVWNEKNGAIKRTASTSIYQITYDNLVGTYKQYLCTGYNYYKESSTSIVYKYGDWSYIETKILTSVPDNTNSTKYVVTGIDFTSCSDSCSLKPYYIVKVYTRSLQAVTQTTEELKASCNVEEMTISVYGKKKVLTKIEDSQTVYLYHTKTRTKLTEEKIEKYLTCETGYTLSDGKCYSKANSTIIGYTCPSSYSRVGKTCYKNYTKTIKKSATPIYKTINSIEYKWSTETKLNGWTKTGKTRNTNVSTTGTVCSCK